MSWFKRDSTPLHNHSTSFSTSLSPSSSTAANKRKCSLPLSPSMDGSSVKLEAFKLRWHNALQIIEKDGNVSRSDVYEVICHLEGMLTLLMQETELRIAAAGSTDPLVVDIMGPLLFHLLSEGVLDHLLSWSLGPSFKQYPNLLHPLLLEQLKIFEVLISRSPQNLFHEPVVRPLLKLLACCNQKQKEIGGMFIDFDERLVLLLNCLCVNLAKLPDLLQVFFDPLSDKDEFRFLVFTLLVPWVHREGPVGDQVRDALLLCMALSHDHEALARHIAMYSDFCPVLATGLSALYSLLPNHLPSFSFPLPHNGFVPQINSTSSTPPELSTFLKSLEFCNAVIEVAHPWIQDQILELLEHGFLEPVLGPSLLQTDPEPATPISYLTLCINSITEPRLLRTFLRFVLAPDRLDILVVRLGSPGPLGITTLALFHTLLDLDCEDVMFELVFKYLISGSHIMVSQRSLVGEVDMYGATAEKLLSFLPTAACSNGPFQTHSLPPLIHGGGSLRIKSHARSSIRSYAFGEASPEFNRGTSDSSILPSPPFLLGYIHSAHHAILRCTRACQRWTCEYDKFDSSLLPPPTSSLHNTGVIVNGQIFSSPHFTDVLGPEKDNLNDDDEFWNLLNSTSTPSSLSELDDSLEAYELTAPCLSADSGCEVVPPAVPISTDSNGSPHSPDIGPFLSVLLARLEMMPSNEVALNLQLTGLLARLAIYPQPLLRSFLLNHTLVFQPTVRSLIQVLGSLKLKMDGLSLTIPNFSEQLSQARIYLASLCGPPSSDGYHHTQTMSPLWRSYSVDLASGIDQPAPGRRRRRSILSSMIFKKNPIIEQQRSSLREPLFDTAQDRRGLWFSPGSPSALEENGEDDNLDSSDWQAVLCTVILAEFLHELAAIALEHGVIQLDPDFCLLPPPFITQHASL